MKNNLLMYALRPAVGDVEKRLKNHTAAPNANRLSAELSRMVM